jgi:hypothetical protein
MGTDMEKPVAVDSRQPDTPAGIPVNSSLDETLQGLPSMMAIFAHPPKTENLH